MNIFFDNYSRTKKFTGVQHYAESLFEWCQEADINPNRVGFGGNYYQHELVSSKMSSIPQMVANRMQRYGIIPKLNRFIGAEIDIAIFPDFVVWPVKANKKVLIVHDFTFLDRPNELSTANAKHLQKNTPKSIKNADYIITTSNVHKERLISDFLVDKSKILILPAIPADFLSEKQKKPNESNYFLCVNSIEPRKNISRLLDAYVSLPEKIKSAHPLVMIGKTRNTGQHIVDKVKQLQDKGENIVYKGHISNKELASYFQNALALVNASLYEGFGMQLLEASMLKKPVVCSSIDIFKDVMGDSAAYFNPNDTKDIARTLEEISEDEKLRKNLVKSATENLKRYNKKHNIKELKKLLKSWNG